MEYKFHGWKVTAIQFNDTEHLLYMDKNPIEAKKNYEDCFYSILTAEEQKEINQIKLERWNGTASKGQWVHQEFLNVPMVSHDYFA